MCGLREVDRRARDFLPPSQWRGLLHRVPLPPFGPSRNRFARRGIRRPKANTLSRRWPYRPRLTSRFELRGPPAGRRGTTQFPHGVNDGAPCRDGRPKSTLGVRASHNYTVPPLAEVSLDVVTPPPYHDRARDYAHQKCFHPSSSFLRRPKQGDAASMSDFPRSPSARTRARGVPSARRRGSPQRLDATE